MIINSRTIIIYVPHIDKAIADFWPNNVQTMRTVAQFFEMRYLHFSRVNDKLYFIRDFIFQVTN